MEKIIAFLIVSGAAALFEFIKDRKKKAGSSRAATSKPKRSPRTRPYAHPMGGIEELLNMRIPDSPVAPPSPVPAAAGSTAKPRSNERPFLPGESHHRPVVAPAQEDETMELVMLPELPDTAEQSPSAESRQLSEHYQRWRRAIIDTAILTPRHSSQI